MLKHSVLISYSSLDQDLAEKVAHALRAKGIKCWVASQNIKPGQSWPAAISDAINKCEIFLVILTANSNNSRQVIRELTQADSLNKILYCFQVEKITISGDLLYFFSSTHRHEAFKTEFGEALDIMAEEISSQLGSPEKDEPVIKDDKDKVISQPVTEITAADQPLPEAEKRDFQNTTLHQASTKSPEIDPPIPEAEQKNLQNEDTDKNAEIFITDTQPGLDRKKTMIWTVSILVALLLVIILINSKGPSNRQTDDYNTTYGDSAAISTETSKPLIEDGSQISVIDSFPRADSMKK